MRCMPHCESAAMMHSYRRYVRCRLVSALLLGIFTSKNAAVVNTLNSWWCDVLLGAGAQPGSLKHRCGAPPKRHLRDRCRDQNLQVILRLEMKLTKVGVSRGFRSFRKSRWQQW
ncbi:uncharacterized protein K460DRAFT_139441 [Cucurbitaria berberidis CBS 394.84]|uniref:Uncharacterized protein n=1 Tax=Cucurbitaria berberidis CBS 394.84 TaxID=1168544 RepID=A0A9P4L6A5_9PLEO|nr:uncharacterized protein K460DRAFT_139441 [Cucurbitaria berberidis CBS 394.84]KAF1843094.1 hypothetical protein K460DRAFT_139441 [Cucurbitaria berberidis CBS 394.84]